MSPTHPALYVLMHLKNEKEAGEWWHIPLAPVLGLLREGSLEFDANLEQSEFQNR